MSDKLATSRIHARQIRFRHNVKHVEDMAFMHEAGVFTEKITTHVKRLRGKINESAFKKCIDTYLKTSVAVMPHGTTARAVNPPHDRTCGHVR